MRIVVLGGGFGGVATVRHLERALRRRTDVEITLVSREKQSRDWSMR
jgi:NADH dehydrogenase FAD-containing subunit